MRFAFVDIAYGYTAERPDADAPLGGTTSAICFLARELIAAGIDCTFFNRITAPAIAHGIPSLPLDRLIAELADPSYSAVIFCGRWIEDMVRLVRESMRKPMIAWMHESSLQTKLTLPLDAFDGAVFVSEWQQRVNRASAQPNWRQAVIRNAMNPRVATLFGQDESILAAKSRPPVLIYAGGAARGVFHLPPILDRLRQLQPDFSVEIFCNTDFSGQREQDEQYAGWLRRQPNVSHVGMVGQPELAWHMREAAFFVAPNPWPETSCIALIEAMASGLSVIATNRAALPETASGYAQQIEIETPDDPLRFDMPVPHEAFAEAASAAIDGWLREPEKAEARLREQVDYFLAHYQWSQRVASWVEFVKSF